MGMESWLIQVDQNIKDNGKKEKNMEEEYIIIKMVWFFKDVLFLAENMEMEYLLFLVELK